MQSYIDELDTGIFPFVDYEGYDDRYPTLSVQSFPAEFYDEIRHASRMLFQIFYKATKVFQQAPDEFALNMDMPENLIPYLHRGNPLAYLRGCLALILFSIHRGDCAWWKLMRIPLVF